MTTIATTNKQIRLAKRPQGTPAMEDFQVTEQELQSPKENEILVRTLFLSVDPYMRGRMNDAKSYVAPYQLNEVIEGGVVAEVVESNSDKFKKGDIVNGILGWQEYSVVNEKLVRKISPEAAPVTTSLGVLGMPGLTAYFGITDIGKPKSGETVVVSGAAGAVGSVVGQIAKIQGARVVGIAGTDEKVAYLKEQLGFDDAVNYKNGNLYKALKQACPNGVDVYFDNVGGEVSDAVYMLLNDFARIPLCGTISSYNADKIDIGPRLLFKFVQTRTLLKGFIVTDYAQQFGEATKQLGEWVREGKLKYEETIVEGFDNIPNAFLGLFKGENVGKQLVKIADPLYAKL